MLLISVRKLDNKTAIKRLEIQVNIMLYYPTYLEKMTDKTQFLIDPPGFDSRIQDELVRLGYSVIPKFFNDEELARMIAMWDFFSTHREVMSPISKDANYKSTLTTATDRDTNFRNIVNGAISPDIENALQRLTSGYRLIGAGFIDKEPGFGWLPMHQDTSIIQDESKIQCVTIWVALTDVDMENGGLSVIPCSHLDHRSPRALFSKFPGLELEDELRANYSKAIPLKTGEAVIFDRSLFHDSAPNPGESRRPAVQIVLCPKHIPSFYHVHREEDGIGMLDCYSVPDNFFLNHAFGTQPDESMLVGTMPEVIDQLDLSALRNLQKAAGF